MFSGTKNSERFYLTGGTALSEFYFKHRLSEDLDFMTSEENLVPFFAEDLASELKNKNYAVDIRRKFNTFSELIVSDKKDSTKIHIAQDSPFRFEEPRKTEYGIYVDSLIDIITNKLLCIYGRYEIRDYIDIYFAIKTEKMDLIKVIKKAKEKDPGLEEYFLAFSFQKIEGFPDNIDDIPVKILKTIDFKDVKKFFLENAVQLLDKRK
ncbi:MAG: nucleotidyl transferase AbiEii/AbiGii toxin family protein [Elusimicrobiota bacterium]